MERFSTELIYLIVFAAFVLFNWLTQLAARRRQQEEQAQAGEPVPEEQPALESEPPPEYNWGRSPVPEPPVVVPAPVARPAPQPVKTAPTAAARFHPVRALLKDKGGLRRAVVLSIVLGPCRALEPPEHR